MSHSINKQRMLSMMLADGEAAKQKIDKVVGSVPDRALRESLRVECIKGWWLGYLAGMSTEFLMEA